MIERVYMYGFELLIVSSTTLHSGNIYLPWHREHKSLAFFPIEYLIVERKIQLFVATDTNLDLQKLNKSVMHNIFKK